MLKIPNAETNGDGDVDVDVEAFQIQTDYYFIMKMNRLFVFI